jgi:hypothetical protein
VTDALRPTNPPNPAAEFRRALDGALTAASVARVGLRLLERHLDGEDLHADHDPLLRDLAGAADRLRDEIRTLTELAGAVLGGTDTSIRIE